LLYTEFCAEHELVPVDKSVMGRQLPTLLPGIKDERPKIEGKQIRVWVGVKVKNIEDIQDIQVNFLNSDGLRHYIKFCAYSAIKRDH
jgi:hypothetical protein